MSYLLLQTFFNQPDANSIYSVLHVDPRIYSSISTKRSEWVLCTLYELPYTSEGGPAFLEWFSYRPKKDTRTEVGQCSGKPDRPTE